MGKIYCVEFQRYIWNSIQNIIPIYWKICFIHNVKMLRALRFKSSYVFLTPPPPYCVEFQRYIWNSIQNIIPIYWKICFIHNVKMLRALRFKSSYVFLTPPPPTTTHTHTHTTRRRHVKGFIKLNRHQFYSRSCSRSVVQGIIPHFNSSKPSDAYMRR